MKKLCPKTLLALLVVPLFLTLWFKPAVSARGPYYVSAPDPAYHYLMNVLTALTLHSPVHRDHPGTPVQILGAVALRLQHPLTPVNKIVTDVIQKPEVHLLFLSKVVFAVFLFSLVFAAWLVGNYFGSIVLGVLFQLVLLFDAQVWRYIGRFDADLPVCSVGILLVALCLTEKKRLPLVAGILSGFAIAIKFTAAPLLLVPIFLIGKKPKLLVRYFAITLLSFLLSIAPILNKSGVAYLANWVLNLAAHDGIYGSGSVGVPSLSVWLLNVLKLWSGSWVIMVATLAIVFLILKKQKTPKSALVPDRHWVALAICLVAALVLVSKHPAAHYLLPITGAASFLVIFAIAELLHLFKKKQKILAKQAVLAVAACIAVLQGVLLFPNSTESAFLEKQQEEIERLATQRGCKLVEGYLTYSQTFALAFGDVFAAHRFSKEIGEKYPGKIFFGLTQQTFYSTDLARQMSLEELKKSKSPHCISSHNKALDENLNSNSLFQKAAKLEKIFSQEKGVSLYALRWK